MLTSTIHSGGVDTDEVGSISGDIDVATTVTDGRAVVTAAYTGALDIYTVTGSGFPTSKDEPLTHEAVIAHLGRELPRDGNGNVPSATLAGFGL